MSLRSNKAGLSIFFAAHQLGICKVLVQAIAITSIDKAQCIGVLKFSLKR